MTYLSDKSRKSKKYTRYSIFVFLLIVIVYFWPTVQKKLFTVIEPVVVFYSKSKSTFLILPSSFNTYFSSRNQLSKKVESLELTVERLENELAEKNGIIKENNFIEVGSIHEKTSTLVMYPVIRDVTNMYSSILLSKGYKDGIEEGSIVYVRGRQPVCTIVSVYDSTSLCKLLSAPKNAIEGVVASSSLTLSLIGDGNGAFISEVAHGTNVSVGENVYLVSNQTMMLGTIVDIVRDEQATSWHVYIRGVYNPIKSSVFYLTK